MAQRTLNQVYVNRRMAALIGIGFASGLPNVLAGDTLSAWLSSVDIDVQDIGLFSLIALPYAFKFLWAPIMDRYVPLGLKQLGRRRGWLLITQMLLAIALAAIAATGPNDAGDSLAWLAVLGVALVFLSASQDIVADAYRTDVVEKHELGAGAAVFVTGYRIATITGGGLALIFARWWGWPTAFAFMSAMMALTVAASIFAPSPRDQDAAPQTLRDAVVQPVVLFIARWGWMALVIAIFVIVFRLPDLLAKTMTMPLLVQDLHFETDEVGYIRQMLGFFITIVGALMGGGIVARFGVTKSLVLFGVLQAASNGGFLMLAMSERSTMLMAVVISVESFCGGLVAAGFVAFLMSCCDRKYSATQYAILSGLMALGGHLGGAPMGFLVHRVGYPIFFAITIAAAVPGMLMLPWLPKISPVDEPPLVPPIASSTSPTSS